MVHLVCFRINLLKSRVNNVPALGLEQFHIYFPTRAQIVLSIHLMKNSEDVLPQRIIFLQIRKQELPQVAPAQW